jgi:hypothetical protein
VPEEWPFYPPSRRDSPARRRDPPISLSFFVTALFAGLPGVLVLVLLVVDDVVVGVDLGLA